MARSAMFILALTLLYSGCGCMGDDANDIDKGEAPDYGFGDMTLSSPAFDNGTQIPARYTADGEDISPPLTFDGVPNNTQSLALIVDDPDAPKGTWVHWLVWNIPPGSGGLSEDEDITYPQGKNDFGDPEYGGPDPPSGTHRYYFKLYALDIVLDLEEGATKERLTDAMEGHVLAKAVLMGKYSH